MEALDSRFGPTYHDQLEAQFLKEAHNRVWDLTVLTAILLLLLAMGEGLQYQVITEINLDLTFTRHLEALALEPHSETYTELVKSFGPQVIEFVFGHLSDLVGPAALLSFATVSALHLKRLAGKKQPTDKALLNIRDAEKTVDSFALPYAILSYLIFLLTDETTDFIDTAVFFFSAVLATMLFISRLREE